MSTGSQKTVYFYEIAQENETTEKVFSVKPGFWLKLHDRVSQLNDVERRYTHYGRKMLGEARTCGVSGNKYFYIGRARKGADWPDFSDANGTVSSLPITNVQDVALIEPAYLMNISGTNYIAMVRTTGGPTTSAIERWINHVMGMLDKDESLILRPYVRKDDLERLAKAQGGSRIHMKVEANQLQGRRPQGRMAAALSSVQESLDGNASVEMTVSFGNARPDDMASEAVADTVKEMLNLGVASKLEATLYVPDEHGDFRKDKINFISDRLVARELFGVTADEPISPEAMIYGLSKAIEDFREKTK